MRVALAVASVAMGANALVVEKNRPVSKVITLLKDMQKQLQNEADQDQEIYDKMECWCKTNDKEKTQSIAEAEAKIADLTAAIEDGTAKSAQLTTEIANLDKEVKANIESLAKATALRKKELAEFNEEEKDLLQSIGALKSAVTVLSKHNTFLQADAKNANINIASMLKRTFKVHADMLEDSLTPSQTATVKSFIEAAHSGKAPAYANQSGEIFGILQNMQETFESNLSASQKEEMAKQQAYEDLKAAKEAEIKAGQEQIDKKTNELAATDEKLANDKQDKIDTENSLSADEKFLMMLKEKCAQTDAEWAARQKTRNEEIAAVGKALEFLSSDDAHDLFTRTFNFIQVTKKDQRMQAANVLAKVAAKNPKLAAIATSVKLDAFTKVKKAIDDMVFQIKKQQEDDVKLRDSCVTNFNDNDKATTKSTRDAEDLETKISQLEAQIKNLADEIQTLNDEVTEAQKQLKIAGENREKENAEFQATIADQRATQKLLGQAVNVLKSFYEKKSLLQQEPAGPPPPAGFKSYENNAAGGGVIAMITQIINDAKAAEAEATHDEEDAQKAYEGFVRDSNETITVKKEQIVNKEGVKASAEQDKTSAEQTLDDTRTELDQLAAEKADLHQACDFIMKNFDTRQQAQTEEIEALAQAKAILSGSAQTA